MAIHAEIKEGTLEGFAEGGIVKFLGIPYAAPPTGRLRWCATEDPQPWDGIRDAKRFGPICPQTIGASFEMRQTEQSEDCLYLNVWTRSCDMSAKQPVMLWIHGGGNLGGAGSEDACDGAHLARKGATVVTFNYRLGAFGFLAHPKVGANFAVLDQVAALRWVQSNIAAFGGDPSNVTIFGQSAGAVAVRTLLSCPYAEGLFHRAILQSAGFDPPVCGSTWSYGRAQRATDALFEKLGSQDLHELRQVPTSAVRLASHQLCGLPPKPGHVHTPANLVWMPVVDGTTVVADGVLEWPKQIPLLMGCVENEARYFLKPGGTYSYEILEKMTHVLCGADAEKVLVLLKASGLPLYEQLDQLFTTIIFREPALESVKNFTAQGRRVYYYHFNRSSPGHIASNERAKHAVEIPYIFGNLGAHEDYDETDRELAELLQYAWLSFARVGSPSSPDGLRWPRYVPLEPLTALIDCSVDTSPFPMTDLMSLVNKSRRNS